MASDGMRRTKLLCTIGPASASRIGDLLDAGMDVARVNFSHGTQAEHGDAARDVRGAAAARGCPVAIMVDLAGPKIRLGELVGGSAVLEVGGTYQLRGEARRLGIGDANGASVSNPRLREDVRIGDAILLGDGAAELRVAAIDDNIRAEVVRGGKVRSRAGVAIPASRISAPALTRKDRADIPRAIEIGATYVAQSFVRSADDEAMLRHAIGPTGPSIVAKIETRPAVDNFDAILAMVDGVMIARGDLGVELPYEEVPLIQKQLVRRALEQGVPSIVATQMLESMTAAPRPTRAEASDVANAVFDGADAIMLSGETAIGAYPVEATEAAARILAFADRHGGALQAKGMPAATAGNGHAVALAAAALVAADTSIGAIACYTRSGRTARILASLRPRVPILAFSPDPDVVARLVLVHGVRSRVCEPLSDADHLGRLARLAGDAGIIAPGTPVVFLASTGTPGSGPTVLGVRRIDP